MATFDGLNFSPKQLLGRKDTREIVRTQTRGDTYISTFNRDHTAVRTFQVGHYHVQFRKFGNYLLVCAYGGLVSVP